MLHSIRQKIQTTGLRKITRASWMRRAVASLLLAGVWLSSGCRAEQPWDLWNTYANKFLDKQGRVIDHEHEEVTTSEGEAYAMFFALVANDRARFDLLVDWTEANLADGDLTAHLPAWKWGKAPDGSWHRLDTTSASDADLWMAYSLSEAGRLWHVDKYVKLGHVMADHIAKQELFLVPNIGTTLLPGSVGFHPEENTYYLNPSYMPPMLLAYFAQSEPVWGDVATSLPKLIVSQGGFVMDWISAGDHGVSAMQPPSTIGDGKPVPTPQGGFDAIRVYLWMGIANPKTKGVSESLKGMLGMATYLKSNEVPPKFVGATGKVLEADGPVGFSAAVFPYLLAINEKKEASLQSDRLIAKQKNGLYGSQAFYYDQNLALFALGWQEGRFKFEENGKLKVKWK